MRHCLYIVLIAFFPMLIFAQVQSKTGRFSVDFDRGCVPLEINISDPGDPLLGDKQYIYGDGSPNTTATNFTYNFPGVFQLVQFVTADVDPKTDTIVIRVFEPSETQFTVEKCNLNGVTVTSNDQEYDFIRVYFSPDDSSTLLLGESASFIYPSNTTQTFQTKGFYDGGRENCSLFSHEVNPLVSLTTPQITNASVKETCRDFFVLTLALSEFDSLINYQVEFEQGSTSIIFEGSINSNPLIIEGIDYDKSGSTYCVKVNAVDVCTGDRIEGAPLCQPINQFSSTPFSNLYSSYVDNGIFINLDSVSSGNLQVSRRLSIENEFSLRRVVQNAFTDPAGTLSRQYFYRIDYLDSCNEVLFTAETNPPLITSDRIEENAYTISVADPSNFITDTFQPFYDVGNATVTTELITQNPFTLNLNSANGTRQFLQARFDYTNGISILSNRIAYRYSPVVYVPTAFTPNGDQLNDTLELFGLPTETATTNIYTRWGQLIYTSNVPSPGWDGFINGSLAPEGAYLYEVIFEDSDGEKVIQKGTFALLKK